MPSNNQVLTPGLRVLCRDAEWMITKGRIDRLGQKEKPVLRYLLVALSELPK